MSRKGLFINTGFKEETCGDNEFQSLDTFEQERGNGNQFWRNEDVS